jgi:hypothetical protein
MHAGHELVAPADSEFDPPPADFHGALATTPLRVDPATVALGDHGAARCDQIEGRDGQPATQARQGCRGTEQRRRQLEASGLISQDLLGEGNTPPIRLTRLRLSRRLAPHPPGFVPRCGPTQGQMDGALTIRRPVDRRPDERLPGSQRTAIHLAAALPMTINPHTPWETTAPMPTSSRQMGQEMRVGTTTIRATDSATPKGTPLNHLRQPLGIHGSGHPATGMFESVPNARNGPSPIDD